MQAQLRRHLDLPMFATIWKTSTTFPMSNLFQITRRAGLANASSSSNIAIFLSRIKVTNIMTFNINLECNEYKGRLGSTRSLP